MVTHFICVEVMFQPSVADLHRSIVTTLEQWGEPLRWAITAVDIDRQVVSIEAVITTPTELLIPGSAVRTI
jgi:hypothetical protein